MLNVNRIDETEARSSRRAPVPAQRERTRTPARARRPRAHPASTVPTALAIFGIDWLSALVLAGRDEVYLFGADTVLYMELAKGNIVEKPRRRCIL